MKHQSHNYIDEADFYGTITIAHHGQYSCMWQVVLNNYNMYMDKQRHGWP